MLQQAVHRITIGPCAVNRLFRELEVTVLLALTQGPSEASSSMHKLQAL
jgi:hypothetical protein